MAGVPQAFGVGSVQTLTDAATITLDLAQQAGTVPPATTVQVGGGNAFKVTLGGNRTLNILNAIDGQEIDLYVTQDGTGNRTLSIQNGGTAAVVATGTLLTTTAGATDLVKIKYRADLGKSFVYAAGRAFA